MRIVETPGVGGPDFGLEMVVKDAPTRYLSSLMLSHDHWQHTVSQIIQYGFVLLRGDELPREQGEVVCNVFGVGRLMDDVRISASPNNYWHQDGMSDFGIISRGWGEPDASYTCFGRIDAVGEQIGNLITETATLIAKEHTFNEDFDQLKLSPGDARKRISELFSISPKSGGANDRIAYLNEMFQCCYVLAQEMTKGRRSSCSTLEVLPNTFEIIKESLPDEVTSYFAKNIHNDESDHIYNHAWSSGDTILFHDSGPIIHARWSPDENVPRTPLYVGEFPNKPLN